MNSMIHRGKKKSKNQAVSKSKITHHLEYQKCLSIYNHALDQILVLYMRIQKDYHKIKLFLLPCQESWVFCRRSDYYRGYENNACL